MVRLQNNRLFVNKGVRLQFRKQNCSLTPFLFSHELFGIVIGQVESSHEGQFDALVALLRKIGVWWVVNVEISTNPDFGGKEIDEEGIVSGTVLTLQMLIEVASGNTELLENWRKACAK